MNNAAMRVSIIIPCRNEVRDIGPCLDSVLTTSFPADQMEILVVDGQSEDGTREIVERYAAKNPRIRLLPNPKRIVPTALNIGIEAATGEAIVRMDAHAIYPPDYVPRLVDALQRTGADNVGGCIVTLAGGRGRAARAIAIALSHPFGVGNSWFRVGAPTARRVDTVPYGCFRKEIFSRVGVFDEELVRNQDDEFNHRLIVNGGSVMLMPNVRSYYRARSSFRQLLRMYYQYGYFKPLVARKTGRVMTVRQLVPPAFVFSLFLTGLLSLLVPLAGLAFTAIAGLYLTAIAIAIVPTARRFDIRCAFILAGAFVTMHVGYGAGFLRGIWDHIMPGRAGLRTRPAVPLSR